MERPRGFRALVTTYGHVGTHSLRNGVERAVENEADAGRSNADESPSRRASFLINVDAFDCHIWAQRALHRFAGDLSAVHGCLYGGGSVLSKDACFERKPKCHANVSADLK